MKSYNTGSGGNGSQSLKYTFKNDCNCTILVFFGSAGDSSVGNSASVSGITAVSNISAIQNIKNSTGTSTHYKGQYLAKKGQTVTISFSFYNSSIWGFSSIYIIGSDS